MCPRQIYRPGNVLSDRVNVRRDIVLSIAVVALRLQSLTISPPNSYTGCWKLFRKVLIESADRSWAIICIIVGANIPQRKVTLHLREMAHPLESFSDGKTQPVSCHTLRHFSCRSPLLGKASKSGRFLLTIRLPLHVTVCSDNSMSYSIGAKCMTFDFGAFQTPCIMPALFS